MERCWWITPPSAQPSRRVAGVVACLCARVCMCGWVAVRASLLCANPAPQCCASPLQQFNKPPPNRPPIRCLLKLTNPTCQRRPASSFHSPQDVFNETRSILEPAGAVAVAGAKAFLRHYSLAGRRVVAVTSGANMNFDRLRLVSGGRLQGGGGGTACAWCRVGGCRGGGGRDRLRMVSGGWLQGGRCVGACAWCRVGGCRGAGAWGPGHGVGWVAAGGAVHGALGGWLGVAAGGPVRGGLGNWLGVAARGGSRGGDAHV
jgi:hypothetical protein